MELSETKIVNADQIEFRSSGLGYIMGESSGLTDKQAKLVKVLSVKEKITEKQGAELLRLIEKRDNPELPDGCKTHLVDVFVSAKYGRKEDARGKQLDKGNEREEDSITLVSLVTGKLFKKNEVHLSNGFIKGTPDLFEGIVIQKADKTRDTKTLWSANTFHRAKNKELDKLWYWQGNGYMWLTGAKQHTVDLCLVNGTEKAINDEKRALSFAMQIIDPANSPEYIEKCKQIEINHIFDLAAFQKEYPWFEFHNDVNNWTFDIPLEDRHHSFTFERSETNILKIEKRVIECRKWMNENLFKI